MNRSWVISCFLLLIIFPRAARCEPGAASAAAVFAEGNGHYQSGDFAAAERSYRLLLDQGIDSGAVYYNLGNACFKQKKLGEAI